MLLKNISTDQVESEDMSKETTIFFLLLLFPSSNDVDQFSPSELALAI